jgi:hypothetical protein
MQWRVVDAAAGPETFAPLEADETKVRVTHSLDDAGYAAVATLLADRPDVQLWIDNQVTDVELLRHFAGLRLLGVTSLRLASWDGLRHVADSLTELHMGETLRRVSIAPMRQLSHLTALGLHGPIRDAEVIAELVGITDLQLRSVTLADLSTLRPLTGLRSLWIGLGGTADLALLAEFRELEELELWRIRGLRDISMLGSLPSLRVLQLQSMSTITELPSFRGAERLRTLVLDTMKGIADLRPVAEAPALEELLLVAMAHLEPDALRPLVGHPTLRRGVWGFGSDRKNAEAWELLPLGEPPFNYERWKARPRRRDGAPRS